LRQRGGQLAGSGLIGERLAEPSHGAVEMMQLKGLSALDPVVGSPSFPQRGPSPTQNSRWSTRQEYRAPRQQTRIAGLRPALLTLRGSRPHATAARTAAPVQSADTLHWVGFALDQRQHHRTLRQPDDGARQPVEITARNDHFLAPEIGDDALLGATLLAYVLDQVDVGEGPMRLSRANILLASEGRTYSQAK